MVARPRSGGQRRYACAKGVGFSGCGKTYITADEVERFVTEAVLHRLDSPQLQKAVERRQRRIPETERWWQEAEAASAQLDELAAAYGQRTYGHNSQRGPSFDPTTWAGAEIAANSDLTLPLLLTLEQVAPSLPPAASTGRE